MDVLVTGATGFVGSAVCRRLLEDGHGVIGIDNLRNLEHNDIRVNRLKTLLGFNPRDVLHEGIAISNTYHRFLFRRIDIDDEYQMEQLFDEAQFDAVIHLAAQTGVRASLTSPQTYVRSNVDGFLNVLEGCRLTGVKHLVYASSSSVYGLNGRTPFSENDGIAHPVSLYAATKKSNELMAHAYSSLYGLPTTGLRLFTVYGPWGRPDMSPYLFIDAILNDEPIKVYNNGDMLRDFTYIDDVVESIVRIMEVIPEGNPNWDAENPDPASSPAPYRIYNVGNQQPVRLIDYIRCIERATGREALKEMLPMQPGDVYQTFADSSALYEATGFRPSTSLEDGIRRTVEWLVAYGSKYGS